MNECVLNPGSACVTVWLEKGSDIYSSSYVYFSLSPSNSLKIYIYIYIYFKISFSNKLFTFEKVSQSNLIFSVIPKLIKCLVLPVI